MKRLLISLAAVAALVAALAVPAGATKPDPSSGLEDGHKITICHATRSLSNPYVEITIDIAAWNDTSDKNSHGDHHTRTKDDVTWFDYILEEGECSLPTPPPPPPPTTTTTTEPPPPPEYCAGQEVDIAADFPESLHLYYPSPVTYALSGLAIPAGTYDVVLGSWDPGHPEGSEIGQLEERWRANFGSDVSDYSMDLPGDRGVSIADAIWSDGGQVTIGATTAITAEHWSIVNTSDHNPNSIRPLCVGLIAVG